MASWIVHLRIAEILLDKIPGLDAEQFAVGNIAPDSGMPDEKWENFTPPTEVTHFGNLKDNSYFCYDLKFYSDYLADDGHNGSDKLRYAFLFGYFCHLVTDNLWRIKIGRPTRQRFQAQFDADPDFIWEVKKDWYGLDFEYVRSHPESLFWKVFLNCAYPTNYMDFLLPEGVRQRIEYIKTYYQSSNERIEGMISRQRIYLTAQQMDDFVEEAAVLLYEGYRAMGAGKLDINGHISLLELIPSIISESTSTKDGYGPD